MRYTLTVDVDLDDNAERFFDGDEPIREQIREMLQCGLDDYSCNAADDTFDDDGRISVNFTVRDADPTLERAYEEGGVD